VYIVGMVKKRKLDQENKRASKKKWRSPISSSTISLLPWPISSLSNSAHHPSLK